MEPFGDLVIFIMWDREGGVLSKPIHTDEPHVLDVVDLIRDTKLAAPDQARLREGVY